MTKSEALTLLGLSESASLDEIKHKFSEVQNDYQMRLTNAPTPNLKKLYQKNLQELEGAKLVLMKGDSSENEALPSSEPSFQTQSFNTKLTTRSSSNTASSFDQPKVDKTKKNKIPEKKGSNVGTLIFAALFIISLGVAILVFILKGEEEKKSNTLKEKLMINNVKLQQEVDSLLAVSVQYEKNFLQGKIKIKNTGTKPIKITWIIANYVDTNGEVQKYEGYLDKVIKGGGTASLTVVNATQTVWDGSVITFVCELKTGKGTFINSANYSKHAKDGCFSWNFDK